MKTKSDVMEAFEALVAENPEARNPVGEDESLARCVYQQPTATELHSHPGVIFKSYGMPRCAAGAILHKLGLPVPRAFAPMVRWVVGQGYRTSISEDGISLLVAIQERADLSDKGCAPRPTEPPRRWTEVLAEIRER